MSIAASSTSASEYWRNAEERRFAHPQTHPDRDAHISRAERVTDMRKALDLEMDAVVILMCSLRARYNAVAPINQLPSEVLAQIFCCLQELDPPSPLPESHEALRRIGWLRATHVCRQWRSAALAHPHLWSTILSSLGREWAEAFLQRSKMVPISFNYIRLNFPAPRPVSTPLDIAGTITQHLSHMRDLRINTDNFRDTMLIPHVLLGAAPALETVVLISNRLPMSFTDPMRLPINLFNQTAPRLRDLKVLGFNFAWPSIAFSSLQRLHMRHLSKDAVNSAFSVEPGTAGQKFSQFIDALSRMPALEALALEWVLPPLSLDAVSRTTSSSPVALSKLRTLELTDNILGCAATLKRIVVSATTTVEISCAMGTNARLGSDVILPWLTSNIGGGLSSVTTLEIVASEDSFDLTGWDVPGPVSEGSDLRLADLSKRRPVLQLSFNGYLEDEPIAELRTACRVLPFEHLEWIHINFEDEDEWDMRDWLFTFHKCEGVQQIDVTGCAAISLCEALATNVPMEGHAGPLFPSLVTLTLLQVDFNDIDFRRKLPEWLRLRKSLAPLQRMKISRCSIDLATLSKIRDVVTEVFWDYLDEAVSGE